MSIADAAVSLRKPPPARAKGETRSLRRPDLDGIVMRVFGFEAVEPDGVGQADPRDFDIAFQALRRGAANLGELQTRCDRLQAELATTAERHRAEMDEARHELLRWQAIATELSDKLDHAKARWADADRAGASQAEETIAATRRAELAERRMRTFERLTLAVHDSILAVFREGAAAAS